VTRWQAATHPAAKSPFERDFGLEDLPLDVIEEFHVSKSTSIHSEAHCRLFLILVIHRASCLADRLRPITSVLILTVMIAGMLIVF
jgi:hypothetical protein